MKAQICFSLYLGEKECRSTFNIPHAFLESTILLHEGDFVDSKTFATLFQSLYKSNEIARKQELDSTNENAYKHKLNQPIERPYSCKFCEKRFSEPQAAIMHVKKSHPESENRKIETIEIE